MYILSREIYRDFKESLIFITISKHILIDKHIVKMKILIISVS